MNASYRPFLLTRYPLPRYSHIACSICLFLMPSPPHRSLLHLTLRSSEYLISSPNRVNCVIVLVLFGLFHDPPPGKSIPVPVAGFQRSAGFAFQRISDDPLVSKRFCRSASRTVQDRAGIPCSVRTVSCDLNCQSIVQQSCHRSSNHRYTDEFFPIIAGNAELVTVRRLVVPVMFANKRYRSMVITRSYFKRYPHLRLCLKLNVAILSFPSLSTV